MKKVLAVALAVVMMLSVSVMAFAANPITNDSEQTETINVVTSASAANDKYTVSVPASVTIPWNNDGSSNGTADYQVTCNLVEGSKVTVSAAADNSGVMTSTDTADTLTFAVSGGEAAEFAGMQNNKNTAVDATINSFAGVAVGAYTGTMTYTVVYTPATGA